MEINRWAFRRPPGSTGPNQHWAMDFMRDYLIIGCWFRMLAPADLYGRCCAEIIRTDNGPEFTEKALALWRMGRE